MSTMFSSSSGLNKSEITVTSTNQIISGYKDYDNNGNLLTGSNDGYDAGVTQGEANMKSGVTVTAASQVLSGYKARTSSGTLVSGTDAGYSAGVTQGHADRDSGVTVTSAAHVLSGYKGRTNTGTLVTGTDKGYNAGVTQGHTDRDSGVTVTAAGHILSGYKGRNSSGTLLTGTAVNPSGAKSITSNGNGQDVKAYATVNVSVPNSNSGTYTFPANDTGGTKDLGATNSYRYVNAQNVYNKGKADGGSGKATVNVSYISEGSSTTGITFSATSGRVYAVVFGGKNGDNPSGITGSGYTQLGYRQRISDSAGAAIAIIRATAASVTINTNATFPYQGSVIVMQITS